MPTSPSKMNSDIKMYCLLMLLVTSATATVMSGIHKVILDTNSWSPWSPWTPCSRSCGSEGIQTRRRVCLSSQGCDGVANAWRVCALSECPEPSRSLRDEQCARYNNVPYQGTYHLWVGVSREDSPCSLDCRTEGNPDIINRFETKAEDGTKCDGGNSLKLCLDGVCEEIGCDLELRTGKRLDKCGKCGGNGSSCSKSSVHSWTQLPISSCSMSCGGGMAMVQHQCVDITTNQTVSEEFCDPSLKPKKLFAKCNENKCPPRWEVSNWSRCQKKCNGVSTRKVECVSDEHGAKILVDESLCLGSRPDSQMPCTNTNCPSWSAGDWSGCSVSCGAGIKQRSVICRNESGGISSDCLGEKPTETEPCHSKCTHVKINHDAVGWEKINKTAEDFLSEDHTIVIQDEYNDEIEESDDKEEADADNDFAASRSMKNIVGTNPNFIVDSWSPCSASCGEGMRFRKVECKIFMEFSKTVATLPDKECPGVKPPETEICVDTPSCSGSQQIMSDHQVNIVKETLPIVNEPELLALLAGDEARSDPETANEPTYSWKIAGFTTCTASCLGGLQESIVICVETSKETPVAPYFCDPDKRLEIEVRTCNENPCPPRWNVSDFTTCSQSCGGGIQTRSVQCIQEVAHGDHNIIQLSDGACPQPPPRSQQFCNVIDCPPGWQASPWTKCSQRCNGGKRYRKVRCQQLLSLGQLIDKPETMCEADDVTKPDNEEDCNMQQCKYVSDPKIRAKEDQIFIQDDPYQGAIKLKVGGTATVYVGTTIKISCPVRHFDKSKITWAKGSLLFHSGKRRSRHSRISVSSKGCLKIKKIELYDDGVFTCMASKSSAKIRINVKPVEPHKTTIPTSTTFTEENNKIWLKSDFGDGKSKNKYQPTNNFNGVQNSHNEVDQPKRKWNSNKQNTIGNEQNFQDKPSKSDKWNKIRENESFDDYIYWDSINNHLEPDKKSNTKNSLKLADTLLSKSEKKKKRRKNRSKKKGKHPKHPQNKNSPLAWKPSPWSLCSKSCGGGFQYRQVQCIMQFSERNNTQDVPESFCLSARIRKPSVQRKCGLDQCYSWIKSPWSKCANSDCVSRNKGLRTRTVQCIRDRRSVVPDHHCQDVTRPEDTQPCHNMECTGVWVLGEWSQCSRTCDKGRRRRTVTCEWLRGGSAPMSECGHEEKPLGVIDCYNPVCHQWPNFNDRLLEPKIILSPARDGRETSPCEDSSKFCGLLKSSKMCAAHNLKEQCCKTCRRF